VGYPTFAITSPSCLTLLCELHHPKRLKLSKETKQIKTWWFLIMNRSGVNRYVKIASSIDIGDNEFQELASSAGSIFQDCG
jgi:hypothetical protein